MPFIEPSNMIRLPIGLFHEVGSAKKTSRNKTPDSTKQMHGDSINSIINAKFDEKFGTEQIDPSCNDTNDNGSPTFHRGTTGCDGNQACQKTIHGVRQIVCMKARPAIIHPSTCEQGAQGSRACCHGGIDGHASSDLTQIRCGRSKGRSWIEAIPTEPKRKGSENGKRCAVTWNVVGSFKRLTVCVIEAPQTRPQYDSGHECCDSSHHMNRTRSSKIDRAAAPKRFGIRVSQESVGRPKCVSDDRIRKANQKEGVEQISFHLGTFCDCPGHDTGQCARKSKLKEPEGVVDFAHQEKVFRSNKGPLACRSIASVGKCVSGDPKTDTSTTGIQEIP
mmetsp:Transcript_5312/g.10973  ORF Transcript_5312/g.10973 Transcript_5312/m.10973 type:complete len:334 (-) Transcript_5312:221-1222(-)